MPSCPGTVAAASAALAIFVLLVAAAGPASAAAMPKVLIMTDTSPGAPVRHGLTKLREALQARGVASEEAPSPGAAGEGILIVTGLAGGSGAAAEWLKSLGLPPPAGPEALLVQHAQRDGRRALVVAGSDDRGLMYALLDVADRVGWAADAALPLAEVRDAREKPAVPERALSMFTMQRADFEARFFDEKYWTRYLDTLARNRFNTFALIFGYEAAGYFAPAYPYFFDVEGYPDVRVPGLTKPEQARNLAMLNRLIRLAHDRGLNVTIGLWDHIYRGGVQAGGVKEGERATREPTPGIPWGVTETNLVPYTQAALARFLQVAPEADAIQFRMHDESGLKPGEMKAFWGGVFDIVKQSGRHIRCDLRAKGLPDEIIDLAIQKGVRFRITTKYWAEQMGMPFHPTHINRQNQMDRRHGYADLLRYPQQYQMHWRLWNGGTSRVLLWGDPEYVRRFAGSTHLYDGDGYEVNEPVTMKMASHPHDMAPFALLKPEFRYYDWEFERYWHFFQVFGRVGYNPDTPPEVWGREFERRFGKEAGPLLEQGLHRASWILPRIIAAVFPYHRFPMTRGWPEKQRWEDLPAYAKVEGSDTQQFAGFDEEARCILEGEETAKTRPPETSRWFARTSAEVLAAAAEAEKRLGDGRGKEAVSTIADLRILGYLALYHSHRMGAATSYALFKASQDAAALDDAIAGERRATEAWEKLVAAADGIYADDLMMGLPSAGLSGHWRDELAALKKGLADLERQRAAFRPVAAPGQPAVAHVPVRKAAPGTDLVIRASIAGAEPPARVRLAYRTGAGDFRFVDMDPAGPPVYRATIPAAAVAGGLAYYIESADAAGRLTVWPKDGPTRPMAVIVTADNDPPAVTHKAIATAPAGKPLTVAARVADPSGVRWVRLRYRSVNQHLDYQTLPMLPTGEPDRYQAVVPAGQVAATWDFQYLIEVMDNAGNGKIYPDMEKETPYVVVRLERGGP